MDQAAFLIELADDLRELLSRSAGQNDGRTLIPKASGCYGAHAGTGAGHDDQLAFDLSADSLPGMRMKVADARERETAFLCR